MTERNQFAVHDADPTKVYRWVNTNERVLIGRMNEGWKVSEKDQITPEARKVLMNVVGQSTQSPDGGKTMRVGDLILMEMPKELHKENIVRRNEQRRERQKVSMDTLILQANQSAQAAMRAKGYDDSQIRARQVFSSSADDNLDSEKGK